MPEPIYVLVNFVIIFIDIISFAMMIRAILSWFFEGDGPFIRFLYVLTEPLILPVRSLFELFGWFEGLTIDIPFLVTPVILMLLKTVLAGLV